MVGRRREEEGNERKGKKGKVKESEEMKAKRRRAKEMKNKAKDDERINKIDLSITD